MLWKRSVLGTNDRRGMDETEFKKFTEESFVPLFQM